MSGRWRSQQSCRPPQPRGVPDLRIAPQLGLGVDGREHLVSLADRDRQRHPRTLTINGPVPRVSDDIRKLPLTCGFAPPVRPWRPSVSPGSRTFVVNPLSRACSCAHGSGPCSRCCYVGELVRPRPEQAVASAKGFDVAFGPHAVLGSGHANPTRSSTEPGAVQSTGPTASCACSAARQGRSDCGHHRPRHATT
jgi:hypothetical protein